MLERVRSCAQDEQRAPAVESAIVRARRFGRERLQGTFTALDALGVVAREARMSAPDPFANDRTTAADSGGARGPNSRNLAKRWRLGNDPLAPWLNRTRK
jgi:hypothetical protein